jgi:hypothetical protein
LCCSTGDARFYTWQRQALLGGVRTVESFKMRLQALKRFEYEPKITVDVGIEGAIEQFARDLVDGVKCQLRFRLPYVLIISPLEASRVSRIALCGDRIYVP